MEFIISKKDFYKTASLAYKSVSNLYKRSVLGGLLIKSVDDDTLEITGYNLEMAITTYTKAQIIEKGSIIITAKVINDILRNTEEDSIHIKKESNNIMVNTDKTSFELFLHNIDDYPTVPTITDEEPNIINREKFIEMVNMTEFATTDDSTRPILTGVCLDAEGSNVKLIGVDGYRLAVYTLDINFNEKIQTIMPRKTLIEVSRILSSFEDDDIKIYIKDRYMLFESDNSKIIMRVINSKYINYEDIIPDSFTTTVQVKKSDILRALNRADVLSERNHLVEIKLTDNNMNLQSNSEFGSLDDNILIAKTGSDLRIGFNSRYLTDVLKRMEEEDITMEFGNDIQPVVIYSTDKEKYLYLSLPVKLAAERV